MPGKRLAILLLHGVLVAGRSEHPIVLLKLVADRLQMREQPGVEAFVGEEAGDPNGVEVCAVGRLEHEAMSGPPRWEAIQSSTSALCASDFKSV